LEKDKKTLSFDTVFGDFCDDNVCSCTVSALILLPVVNLSPETDSGSQVSYETWTIRL